MFLSELEPVKMLNLLNQNALHILKKINLLEAEGYQDDAFTFSENIFIIKTLC